MLAPLEDLSIPTAGSSDEGRAADGDVRDLRRALRASRLRLRRNALQSARQLIALNAEISHLQLLCERAALRLDGPLSHHLHHVPVTEACHAGGA